jgi:hypothetical protein
MTSFRRRDPVALAIPYEKGLAKARTRGNQGAGSAGFGFSGIQDTKFLRRKVLDAVSRRAQIIQEHNLGNVEFSRKRLRINGPRKVRGANPIIHDRAGDPETRREDTVGGEVRRGLARKFLNNQFKLRELFAREALLENRCELAASLRKEREVALGTADVARQNHAFPLCIFRAKT